MSALEPFWAVHVADGQLDTRLCLSGWLAASVLVVLALRKTEPNDISRIAVLSAVFFLASLLHVPTFVGARTHLLLTGLLGILLGWQSLLAIGCGLALQAILFSHGGFFSLGINLLVMGIPALICGQVFRLWIRAKITNSELLTSKSLRVPSFATGALSVLLVSSFYGLALISGGVADWWPQIIATWIIHLPIALLEGFLCAGVVDFQLKVAPETLLGEPYSKAPREMKSESDLKLTPPVEANPQA